jgi:dihydrofolate reductase
MREADAMRKLTFAMNMSLDGYIAAPGDDHGWSVPSDELFQWWSDRVGATDLTLYRRKLWETMSSHWPTADQQPGATAAPMTLPASLTSGDLGGADLARSPTPTTTDRNRRPAASRRATVLSASSGRRHVPTRHLVVASVVPGPVPHAVAEARAAVDPTPTAAVHGA